MKKFLRACLVVSLATFIAIPSASAIDPDTAATVFAKLAVAPELRNPSVSLIDLSTGAVVFEANGDSERKPASLMKLLSAAATVKYLDPTKVFATSVSLGTTADSIVVDGEFDPWMATNYRVAQKMHRTSLYSLAAIGLSAAKKSAGGPIKKIKVYYNDIYPGEAATISAYYKKQGVIGTFINVTDEKAKSLAGQQVFYSTSPPVKEIMSWFLTWSDNEVAERMGRLAARASGNPFNDQGVATTFTNVLADLGLDSSKVVVKDASGLSRQNKVTADLVGRLLAKFNSDPALKTIIDGLPVGGKTGTLRKRYKTNGVKAAGLVKAKTGTLTGTVGLAGYVQSGDREYAFVIIADRLKRTPAASAVARNSVDRYLAKIAAPLSIPAAETSAGTPAPQSL